MPVVHPEQTARPAHPPLPPALVEIDDLRYSYPDGQPALLGVSLRIAPGEKVALVGPNGAGKSTLLLHLNGILGGPESPLRVCGLPPTKKNLPVIRGLVGLVFQNPDDQLFSPTVLEDVAFGPLHMGLAEAEVRRRAALALAQVGMAGFEERLPHHLSIGQKKRIAIATVLAMSAELLALDEPTAGLDPRGRRQLIDLLRALPQTLLVSTHDMALVRDIFPRTIIMDGGRVVADGATGELLRDAGLLAAHGLEVP
ncbi:putative ABC transporter ATP-binding protein SAV_3608 [Candidatus Promineifilum breve]|uniref:ABC transporter ATP-binding protein SAV_3608 n=1 Tax=Candidatus Promineifilum breve TaxID=1806508 RepID=A0A160T8C6_9CHLR|nr:ABC transporter ATP-binding protein [Candidatus Promineifilum breve]CUS05658.1 putative ABC transporter ATP-binding protein SAV_3608 [Candidatus Promineifilum breve]